MQWILNRRNLTVYSGWNGILQELIRAHPQSLSVLPGANSMTQELTESSTEIIDGCTKHPES